LACSNACQSKNEYGFCDMKRELVLEKERKTFGRCLDFVGKGLGVEECEICEKKSVGCSTDVGFDHDCDGIPSTGGGSSQITP